MIEIDCIDSDSDFESIANSRGLRTRSDVLPTTDFMDPRASISPDDSNAPLIRDENRHLGIRAAGCFASFSAATRANKHLVSEKTIERLIGTEARRREADIGSTGGVRHERAFSPAVGASITSSMVLFWHRNSNPARRSISRIGLGAPSLPLRVAQGGLKVAERNSTKSGCPVGQLNWRRLLRYRCALLGFQANLEPRVLEERSGRRSWLKSSDCAANRSNGLAEPVGPTLAGLARPVAPPSPYHAFCRRSFAPRRRRSPGRAHQTGPRTGSLLAS